MIARREVLGGGMVASLFGGDAGAADPQMSERMAVDITTALKGIRTAIDAQQTFADILPIRQRLVDYLRAQMKFPDYMDVGTDPWFAVYDWHVKHRQPLVLGRDPNGRYTLQFVQTALILRPDLVPNHLGTPFDAR